MVLMITLTVFYRYIQTVCRVCNSILLGRVDEHNTHFVWLVASRVGVEQNLPDYLYSSVVRYLQNDKKPTQTDRKCVQLYKLDGTASRIFVIQDCACRMLDKYTAAGKTFCFAWRQQVL